MYPGLHQWLVPVGGGGGREGVKGRGGKREVGEGRREEEEGEREERGGGRGGRGWREEGRER